MEEENNGGEFEERVEAEVEPTEQDEAVEPVDRKEELTLELKCRNRKILSIVIVGGILLILWMTFFWYLVNYGDAVRGNPLSFATKKLGIDCTCTSEKIPGGYLYSDKNGNVREEYAQRRGEGGIFGDLNITDRIDKINITS